MYHSTAMRVALAIAMSAALPLFVACTGDAGDGDTGLGVADAGVPPVWNEQTNVPTTEDLFAVWGRAVDDVWAVGWNSTIVHYDGFAWTKETTTSTIPLTDIHGRPKPADPATPPGAIFACGWGGTILQRDITGNWAKVQLYGGTGRPTSTATQDLFSLYTAADDSAIAVGDQGRVLGWDGRRWSIIKFVVLGEISGRPISPLEVLKASFSRNPDRYWIVGSGGSTYRSSGVLSSFESVPTEVPDPLHGVWGSIGGGPLYAVGLGGLVLGFDNGQWRRIRGENDDSIPNVFLSDIDGLSGSDITVVGWRGIAVRFLNGQWYKEETGIVSDLRGVWVDPETGTAFAVGAHGTIIRRDPPPPPDAGVTD